MTRRLRAHRELSDGREVMQVRLPLGIEQYELDGRPDGKRPHHTASLLDHQLASLEKAKTAHKEAEFRIDPDACIELSTKACSITIGISTCFNSRTGHGPPATRAQPTIV